MRPADHQRVAMSDGLAPDNGDQVVESSQEKVGGGSRLQRQRRVDDVRAGESDVDEPGVRARCVSPVARKKAMTSWSTSRSISRIRSRSHEAARMAGIALSGMRPRRFHASHTAFSTASHASIRLSLAPDRAHLGTGIALDHVSPLAPFPVESTHLPDRVPADRPQYRSRLIDGWSAAYTPREGCSVGCDPSEIVEAPGLARGSELTRWEPIERFGGWLPG